MIRLKISMELWGCFHQLLFFIEMQPLRGKKNVAAQCIAPLQMHIVHYQLSIVINTLLPTVGFANVQTDKMKPLESEVLGNACIPRA